MNTQNQDDDEIADQGFEDKSHRTQEEIKTDTAHLGEQVQYQERVIVVPEVIVQEVVRHVPRIEV